MSSTFKRITYIALAIAISATLVSAAAAADKADYVFKNGAVYTIDSKNPSAQAIAVTGKQISYVGSNEGVNAFVGNKTQVIDLHGQMLLPGFVESHIHPTAALITAVPICSSTRLKRCWLPRRNGPMQIRMPK